MGYLDYSSQAKKNKCPWFFILDHSPNWAIPPTLIIAQPGENESTLGNVCPWLLNLDHSPNWAICLALNMVKPRENESSLGNGSTDHFLWKWLSYTNLQNIPFFETTHHCELQKNDCPTKWTILVDHYSEWLPRRMIVLDHFPTPDTMGIVVYGTSTIYQTIFVKKMTVHFGPFFKLEMIVHKKSWTTFRTGKWLPNLDHFPNWKMTSHISIIY